MKVLEKEIIVSKNDLDELNHVNNIKYVNWILEIAKIHWRSLVSDETLIIEVPYWYPTIAYSIPVSSVYPQTSETPKSLLAFSNVTL